MKFSTRHSESIGNCSEVLQTTCDRAGGKTLVGSRRGFLSRRALARGKGGLTKFFCRRHPLAHGKSSDTKGQACLE